MPERVSRKERVVSMAIEKARDAKQLLQESLYDNNRLPDEKDDRMEEVKVKRTKGENVNLDRKGDGKHKGFGLDSDADGGEETSA